jgi:hypothetical protein
VRGVPPLALAISLAAHIGAVALVLGPAAPHAEPGETPLPAPRLAGDTFELPAPAMIDLPHDRASPPSAEATEPRSEATEDATETPDEATGGTEPRPRRASARPAPPRRPADATPGEEGAARAATGEEALYGAVGERGAVELAGAYARAFTQTASADPAWQKAPLGSAGEAVVALTIDERGRITNEAVKGAPGPALSSSIQRTLALVRGRTFVARGKVTTIRISATVTQGAPGDDGLENDRFGIAVHGGKASFVLPIGRRIQVRVR